MRRTGGLAIAIDEQEVCRCSDTTLDAGHCFVGVAHGSAAVRAPRAEAILTTTPAGVVPGWRAQGAGAITATPRGISLAPSPNGTVALVSEQALNEVELRFSVRLEGSAHLIAKIHHQSLDDPNANSYHLISSPTRHYLARHRQVFADVRLMRGRWHRVQLRWVDQTLELHPRRPARRSCHRPSSAERLLGRVPRRGPRRAPRAVQRERSHPSWLRAHPRSSIGQSQLGIPSRSRRRHVATCSITCGLFTVRRGAGTSSSYRARLDLFNGRRVIGIVHDERSEDPDEVRKILDGGTAASLSLRRMGRPAKVSRSRHCSRGCGPSTRMR